MIINVGIDGLNSEKLRNRITLKSIQQKSSDEALPINDEIQVGEFQRNEEKYQKIFKSIIDKRRQV